MNGEKSNLVDEKHIIGNDVDYPDTESELDIQMMYQTEENISILVYGFGVVRNGYSLCY